MKKIKIVVMTPKYADYDEATKICIRNAVKKLPQIEFIFISVSEVYIHAGRRKLLTKALEINNNNSIDYFFWLDSDIEFKPSDILTLMNSANSKNIISGLYFSRHNLHNPMICYGDMNEGYDWRLPENWDTIPPFFVDGIGFGFVMMSKKLIMDYTSNYPSTEWFQSRDWYPSNDSPDKAIWVVGEDLHFCENAKKIGHKIWVDAKIILPHKGVTYKDYINNPNPKTHCEPKIENFQLCSKYFV